MSLPVSTLVILLIKLHSTLANTLPGQHRASGAVWLLRVRRGILLFTLFLGTAIPVLGHSAGDDFELSRDGDLLSLSANNASLVAIVEELQALTDTKISFSEPFDVAITLDVQDTDLERLIGRLVSNSLITKLDYQSHIKIAEVLLMPDGGESNVSAAALPSGEPAEGVIVDGSLESGEPQLGEDGLPIAPTSDGEAGSAEAATTSQTGTTSQ